MNEKKRKIFIGVLCILLSILVFLFFYSEFYTASGIKKIGGVKKNGGVSQFKNNNVSGGKAVKSTTKKFKFSTWNNFCFLTQISNGLLGLWALIVGISKIFNLKKLEKKVTHPLIVCSLSTLLFFVGIVVFGSFVSGVYRLQVWTNKYFVVSNLRDLFYHIVTPIIGALIAVFLNDDRKLKYKNSILFLILPLTYSIVTFIRGKFILKTWYPYFIFDSHKVWNILKLGNYNQTLACLLVLFIMGLIAVFYFFLGELVIKIRNSRVDKLSAQ